MATEKSRRFFESSVGDVFVVDIAVGTVGGWKKAGGRVVEARGVDKDMRHANDGKKRWQTKFVSWMEFVGIVKYVESRRNKSPGPGPRIHDKIMMFASLRTSTSARLCTYWTLWVRWPLATCPSLPRPRTIIGCGCLDFKQISFM